MQYTIRDVPPNLDQALRAKARTENRSLNQVVIDALQRALGLGDDLPRRRDLSDIAGSWREHPDIEQAFQDQRQIDQALWR